MIVYYGDITIYYDQLICNDIIKWFIVDRKSFNGKWL